MSHNFKINTLIKHIKNLRSYSQQVNQDIIYERLAKNSSIAVLGMNRPKQRNAFSVNLVKEFEDNLSIIRKESDVRVLIIRSLTPGIFCAGKIHSIFN